MRIVFNIIILIFCLLFTGNNIMVNNNKTELIIHPQSLLTVGFKQSLA